MLRLIIEDDEGKTTVVPLIRDEITIGRKEGNTIRLTERNVSRRHARLLRTNSNNEDSTIIVEDLDSFNGIRLNGETVPGKCAMRPGDLIQIGDYQLALQSDDAAQQARAASQSTALVDTIDDEAPGEISVRARRTGQDTLPPEEQGALVVVSSNLAGERFDLGQREVIVGRTDENDIVVNHRSISRNHAKLVESNGQFKIIDLASSNGVNVNGEPCATETLVNGDIIELGHVKFRFVAPGEDYVFTIDDVEDVDPVGRSYGGRMFVIAILLLLVALGAFYLVRRADRDDDAGGPDPGAVDKTTSRPMKPAPGRGKPSTEPTVDIDALMAEAREHFDNQRWAEADGACSRVLQADPNHAEATELRSRARGERENQKLFNAIAAHVENEQWAEAYFAQADLPEKSVFQKRLKPMRAGIEKGFADAELERGHALLGEGEIDGARKVQESLAARPFARTQAAALAREIRDLEREPPPPPTFPAKPRPARTGPVERPKSVERPTKPPKAPRPVEAPPPGESYDDLMKDSLTYIATGKRREAIEVLQKARKLRPQSSTPHRRLCSTYNALGQYKKALSHCEQWLAKEKNASYKPVIRKKIKELQEKLSR